MMLLPPENENTGDAGIDTGGKYLPPDMLLDALAEFAAGAGHEINNPLAIISGRAKLLLSEITDAEHRRQLAVILAQVKRAYEMTADIRFFARPPLPEKTTFDIVSELEITAEEQRTLMPENEIVITVETAVNSFFINTDRVLFHSAVSFLCNNARDSLSSAEHLTGGSIIIKLTLPDREQTDTGQTDTGKIEVAVEDNGKGVSDEVIPLMFYPYYSGRQAGRGLGFGLPKCWKIMQILGGSIRYEKPAEDGARFVLTLPVK